MKIRFCVYDNQYNRIKKFYLYKEIIKYDSNAISLKAYTQFKALEKSEAFLAEIYRIRKTVGLKKQGLNSKYEFERYFKGIESNVDIINKHEEISKESSMLSNAFHLHKLLSKEMFNIIISNEVILPVYPIEIVNSNFQNPLNSVVIFINSKITKNNLKNYVEEKWPEIEKHISRLPNEPEYGISDRDSEIYDLRVNKRLKFREIADLLSETYDNYSINEDQIKTAYHRAVRRISKVTSV